MSLHFLLTNSPPKEFYLICSHIQTMTINNFPNEIFLEIFDRYRHTFSNQLSSERVWNNKNGWFKLAHVCHNWRSIVLASPSRLRLRLYFAGDTPTRAVALERLSHLPIIVDYNKVIWKSSAPKRLSSALRYPNRVCRIAIPSWEIYKDADRVTETLDMSFPALRASNFMIQLALNAYSDPHLLCLPSNLCDIFGWTTCISNPFPRSYR
jgi:hypothetical protein